MVTIDYAKRHDRTFRFQSKKEQPLLSTCSTTGPRDDLHFKPAKRGVTCTLASKRYRSFSGARGIVSFSLQVRCYHEVPMTSNMLADLQALQDYEDLRSVHHRDTMCSGHHDMNDRNQSYYRTPVLPQVGIGDAG